MHVRIQPLLHGMAKDPCNLLRYVSIRQNPAANGIIHIVMKVSNLIRISNDAPLQCSRMTVRLMIGKSVQNLPGQV